MSKMTTAQSTQNAVGAALERAILGARFGVEQSQEDERYGYAVDRCLLEDGSTVLSTALPYDEALRRTDVQRNRAWRYILAKGDTSPNYYGFGAAVVDRLGDNGGVALVQVPAEHADWQMGRLRSGLQTVSLAIFETAAVAIAEYAEAVENGYV